VTSDDQRDDGPTDLVLVVRYAAIGVGVAVVAAIIAADSGSATPAWLIATVCVVGGLIVGLGATVVARFATPPGRLPPPSRRTRTDRESGGLQRVERTIDRGVVEVDRFNLNLRPWLIDLAEHRLRHHAAIDPQHEPDRARDLLGGSLWQLTQQPMTAAPSRQQLAEWVARIEAL
jgi:hypothetical protein